MAAAARMGGESLYTEIDQKILWLAFYIVCQPDKDGNQVISSVRSYFQQLMSAARPFTNQRDFPISVCAKFMEGLDNRQLTGFCRLFPQHCVIQSLNATHQQKVLQKMLQATQQAKDNLVSVQHVAWEAVGLSLAFVSGRSTVALGAYPSQAKKTLSRYSYQGSGGASTNGSSVSNSGSTSSKKGPWPCFGCGGPHPWSKFVDGNHVVICPNKDNPGLAHEQMQKNRK